MRKKRVGEGTSNVVRVVNPESASKLAGSRFEVGKPFTGYVYYDTGLVGSSNLNYYADGNRGNYYFNTTTAFRIVVQVGGHTFANSNSPTGNSCGYVGVDDGLYGFDAFNAESSNAEILLDGASFLKYPELGVLSLYLNDQSTNAYSSILIPTIAPSLAAFPNGHSIYLTGRYDDGHTTLFTITGNITNITAIPQVMLNVHRASADTIKLAWPLVAPGFTLQSRTNLTTDVWQDVAAPVVDNSTDHTVALSSADGNKFFRLKK